MRFVALIVLAGCVADQSGLERRDAGFDSNRDAAELSDSDASVGDAFAPGMDAIAIDECDPPPGPTAEDLVPPELTTVEINNVSPRVGDVLRISIDVIEEGCGLTEANVWIGAEDDPSIAIWVDLHEESGRWSGNLAIDPCFEAWTYYVRSVRLEDAAGHVSSYLAGPESDWYDLGSEQLPTMIAIPRFTADAPGIDPATLTSVSMIETPEGMRVEITTSTPTACALEDEVSIVIDEATDPALRRSEFTSLTNGRATADIVLPECLRHEGTWRLDEIDLNTSFRSYGFAGIGVSFPMPIVKGPPPSDRYGARVSNVEVRSVDRPTGTVAHVRATAVDDVCGVDRGGVGLEHGLQDGPWFSHHFVVDGDQIASCVAIPACAPRGIYQLSQFIVLDRAERLFARCLRGGVYEPCFLGEGDPQSMFPEQTIAIEHR